MGVTSVTTAQLSGLRSLSTTAMKTAMAKRLKMAGEVVAAAARSNASAFSTRIPGSVKVTGGVTGVFVVAGGDSAPNAYPIELGLDHPVYPTGDRSTWHWGKTPRRPFMENAVNSAADLATEAFAGIVDDWTQMLGLTD